MADLIGKDSSAQPFGYADVAFTVADYPTSMMGDSEYDAISLATSDDPIAAKESSLWATYRLDDPERYHFFRNYIPWGDVLTGAAYRKNGCVYCGQAMAYTNTGHERIEDTSWLYSYRKAICGNCGWWVVTCLEESLGIYGVAEEATHAYAVLKQFDPTALHTPLNLARDYLARNHHQLTRYDPYRFEELMADCLRDYFGDAEIVKLGGRHDGGIDIKAVRTNGQTVLIQTKCHADFAKKESVRAVRELHGVMLSEGVPHGMIITTARDFSQAARAESEKASRRLKGYSMELISLEGVVDLLGAPRGHSREPWKELGIQTEGRATWEGTEDWVERSALPETCSIDI